MDFFSSILLCLGFAWICSQALQYSLLRRSKAIPRELLPPGPKPFPLVGNLFELGENPHVSLTKLSQRFGPIICLHLGQVTTVVVSSVTLAKDILRNHDHIFCNRTVPDGAHACNHNEYGLAWLPVSPRWRNLRRICNSHLFAAKVLDANKASRRAKVQQLIDDVDESMRAGEAVDIGRAAFASALSLMSRTIFSIDLADPSSEAARKFRDNVCGIMTNVGKPNLADCFPMLSKLDPQGIRRRLASYFQKTVEYFDYLINQRLDSRRNGHEYITRNDMLDTLLNISEDPERNEDLDMTQVQHLIVDLFVAGTDTTSGTMEWAMAELLRNPEVMLKARAELDEVIGKGKLVEESDIARLPYLQAIIKETFRLHPTVPLLLPRRAESDVEVGGYTVPKGARVLVNVWAIGRDPGTWDNPECFKPERFLGPENEIDVMGKSFELIPFGGGRRICPGLPLAMRMLHLMLGSLINCFDWNLENGVAPKTMNMEEKFGITLKMAQPLKAVPNRLN
ncbi:geraniol 8-hydroxylase-like [Argentina anserina]|uniref:geraniol 8-hydroxylase-like n=1 Tax=Argentina anserina TaxID=57926 RepID=UPI0021764AE4|nr:geraniol 8-hydroxylase-like [Potentilla anserina]